jgi:hypothetical protein
MKLPSQEAIKTMLNTKTVKNIPFTLVTKGNTSCKINKRAKNTTDYWAESYLKYNSKTNYISTSMPLKAYYKPKGVFICCYYSKTYN